jgi:hypothetical protein
MPRKAAIKTTENTTQAIADALDTPLNLEWDTTAEKLLERTRQKRTSCTPHPSKLKNTTKSPAISI